MRNSRVDDKNIELISTRISRHLHLQDLRVIKSKRIELDSWNHRVTPPNADIDSAEARVCGLSLDRLNEFRDKVGAHSDSRASIKSLPSHDEFESLYSFAKDFYELVSLSINRSDRHQFRERWGPASSV